MIRVVVLIVLAASALAVTPAMDLHACGEGATYHIVSSGASAKLVVRWTCTPQEGENNVQLVRDNASFVEFTGFARSRFFQTSLLASTDCMPRTLFLTGDGVTHCSEETRLCVFRKRHDSVVTSSVWFIVQYVSTLVLFVGVVLLVDRVSLRLKPPS
jgi:hypothetical protein